MADNLPAPDPQISALLAGPSFFVKVLDRYGLPTLIAGVLLWILISQIQPSLKEFSRAQETLGKALVEHGNQMKVDQVEQRYYLRMLCINTAKTPQQHSLCGQGPQ